ncbi:MAG: hypothetical protein NVV57_01360 [Demequina sp.]|nr:hypothetical protein [Demequina sp.]
MTKASGKLDGAVSLARGLLWIYTVVICLAAGIVFGNAFKTADDFGYPAFLGGILLGAFGTIPFWALYIVGARALELISAQRHQGDPVRLAALHPTDTATEPKGVSSAERASVLDQLLADPTIRQQATKTRRTYSRKVAAEFLTRKAAEAGHGGVTFTSADLPEDL